MINSYVIEKKTRNKERKGNDFGMMTRSNLVEQLREYKIRSKHEWASAAFFSSTTSSIPSRVDVISVIWELLIFAFLVLSAVSLCFKHVRLAFVMVCVATVFLVCMRIMERARQNRKSKGKMLLPLSM